MSKKVVVGLSGGVDSAVSAYLLKKQGYDVIAVFMENWDDYLNNDILGHKLAYENKGCSSKQDFIDASNVAQFLNIPIYKINFVKEYWNDVFISFLEEYKKGVTPNPDILCNKFIKFGIFKKYVLKQFEADFIATGHYANTYVDENNVAHLLKAKDENKDQTYFLCDLNNEQLHNVIFPLANLYKTEVRKIAQEINLPVWNKKDSTGICFIGERHFSLFLKNYLTSKIGNIIDIKTKKILGTHEGTSFYTIGQRNGLNLGGFHTRYFVCKKDLKNNILYVASIEDEEKYLLHKFVYIKTLNKINIDNWNDLNLSVRFRHRQKLIKCKVILDDLKNNLIIECENEVRAITPGQYAVFYLDDECIGGGIINNSSKNLQNKLNK